MNKEKCTHPISKTIEQQIYTRWHCDVCGKEWDEIRGNEKPRESGEVIPKKKKDKIATYECENCKDEWNFCPDDFGNESDYPIICPLCSMPITQMIRDVFEEEGILEVLKRLFIRIRPMKDKIGITITIIVITALIIWYVWESYQFLKVS